MGIWDTIAELADAFLGEDGKAVRPRDISRTPNVALASQRPGRFARFTSEPEMLADVEVLPGYRFILEAVKAGCPSIFGQVLRSARSGGRRLGIDGLPDALLTSKNRGQSALSLRPTPWKVDSDPGFASKCCCCSTRWRRSPAGSSAWPAKRKASISD
jgi:hypothetical protein